MPKYLDQLERVRRFLTRVHHQDRSPIEYEDDIWSFFQNCWHLKDWVKYDPSVPSYVRNSIEQLVAASPLLMICADLANTTKHLQLTRPPRVGAKYSHWNVTIVPGESSKVESLVDSGSGAQQDALDLARDCVLEWERLLVGQGLAT